MSVSWWLRKGVEADALLGATKAKMPATRLTTNVSAKMAYMPVY